MGNVLVVFNDRKIANTQDQVGVSGYDADVVSASNYYPFGMLMPEMKMDDDRYRYGFQGQETDDEWKGSGNSYDFGARIYDSRLGRWLSVDPKFALFSNKSPYVSMYNKPLLYIDPNGDKVVFSEGTRTQKTNQSDNGNDKLTTADAIRVDLEKSLRFWG